MRNFKKIRWKFLFFTKETSCLRQITISNQFLFYYKQFSKYIQMSCLFTGPKMFCAGSNLFCKTKNLFTYCGSHKHFVPDIKMFAFSKIGSCLGTKVFEEALIAVKFLGWLKIFGPAQNIKRTRRH